MTLFYPVPKFELSPRAAWLRVAIFWKLWRRWKRSQPRQIPTYASNGRRVSDSSPERVKRLLELGYVSVKRHSRTGLITHCQFIYESFANKSNPVRKAAQMGQHYCVKRTIADHQVFQHRDLQQFDPLLSKEAAKLERADADLFLRAVFLEVPLSCMQQPEPPVPPQAPAKVIPFPVKKTNVVSAPEPKAA